MSDGIQTYAIFLYDDLQWSPAVVSPGGLLVSSMDIIIPIVLVCTCIRNWSS